eukprot:scaffold300346_cov38-Prasinocladus_malaysianus.AAC.1
MFTNPTRNAQSSEDYQQNCQEVYNKVTVKACNVIAIGSISARYVQGCYPHTYGHQAEVLMPLYVPIYVRIPSFVHSFIRSFIHSFIHSAPSGDDPPFRAFELARGDLIVSVDNAMPDSEQKMVVDYIAERLTSIQG